jgi:hypothetical protein
VLCVIHLPTSFRGEIERGIWRGSNRRGARPLAGTCPVSWIPPFAVRAAAAGAACGQHRATAFCRSVESPALGDAC